MRFIPVAFSHTGQTHGEFKRLTKEQTRQKLMRFEGEAKRSKVRSAMKWWSKRISMIIAKTASRIVAFKSDKLVEALFQDQSVVQTRQLDMEGVSFHDADFELRRLGA